MKKTMFNGFALGCISTLVLTLSVNTLFQNSNIMKSSDITDLNTVTKIIEQNYYGEYDSDDIVDGILSGSCFNLDDYSTFMTSEEFDGFSTTEQNKYGIGIQYVYDKYDKTFTIKRTYPDSSAFKAGIRKNDKIVAVNGYDTYYMDNEEFTNTLKGSKNTEVELKVLRDSEYLDFTVERLPMYFPLVFDELLTEDTAYIQISSFSGEVDKDFKDALAKYRDIDNIIIDLRDNFGGELDLMLSILGNFIPSSDIGLIEYKNSTSVVSVKGNVLKDYNIVVLCNDSTASSSEFFILALSEAGLCNSVGTTTYGKNQVQEVFKVDEDKYMKLTTGKLVTMEGTDIHDVGFTPDFVVEYEYLGSDFEESDLKQDSQVKTALEILESED